LLELLDDPARALRLGASARRRIDEKFALSVVVDRYVDIYHRMVAGTWPG
jgi:hypothetical protein